MPSTLGDLEREALGRLWDAPAPMTAADLRDALNAATPARDLAVTTVLTVLSRLEKKQFVRREPGGRPFRFTPTRSREEFAAELMHEALGAAGDRQAALARFVGAASADETAALRRLLDGR